MKRYHGSITRHHEDLLRDGEDEIMERFYAGENIETIARSFLVHRATMKRRIEKLKRRGK